MDKNFDIMLERTYNQFKSKYGAKKNVNFGGWTDKGKFISDVVYQSDDLQESLYAAILKRQTAIGDLAKYRAKKEGTINI